MQTSLQTAHSEAKYAPGANEITLHDLIKEIRIWSNLIRQKWWKIVFVGMIGAAVGFCYAYLDEPLYTANTRFMLKNEGVGSLFGGQMTGLTSLLGGGQMGTPLERTAEVIASDRIIGRALLRTITVRDSTDLVINHFIRLSGLRNKWGKDSLLKNVIFSKQHQKINQLSLEQRKAYKKVKSIMVPERGIGVVNKSFDKKSGVLTISCVHEDEGFVIALSEAIYGELTQFFIEQMTFSASNNAEVMKIKLDSIQSELDVIRRGYAKQSDQSLGLLLQQDKVELKALAIKEQMLNVMYAEALKNYEGFQFVNQAAMPSLTLIEAPYSPLSPKNKSKITYTLAFAILITLFFTIYLRILKYINELLR